MDYNDEGEADHTVPSLQRVLRDCIECDERLRGSSEALNEGLEYTALKTSTLVR